MSDRCLVMGVVNITDDSFSDGAHFNTHATAIEHARELVAQGADIIDVGGESTRPGATRVPEEVELQRVVPVIRELSAAGIATSVDTMRASVAEACAAAGVTYLNDVSGGLADPNMYRVMAETGLDSILMHWATERFGDAAGAAHHGNVVGDVRDGLRRLVENATDAGVDQARIILDPGLGFAKTDRDNWELLKDTTNLADSGFRVLIGASRKRFLQDVVRARRALSAGPEAHVDPLDADLPTAVVSALSAAAGAWAVRVHDVAASKDAVEVAHRWTTGGSTLPVQEG